jgi:hypothetical protein
MKRITVTLTEDQARQVLVLLSWHWNKMYYLNVPEEKHRKIGRKMAAFDKRIMALIKRELVR